MVGLVVALLLAAVAPTEHTESTVELVDIEKEKAEKRATRTALGIFFWVLIISLMVAIIARYFWHGTRYYGV
jgi:hypothetical protein